MTINLSTSGFYDRASTRMSALGARAEALQTQVATGKKLAAPSDDAVGYQRLQGLARSGANDAAYGANIKIARGVLAQADSTLGSIGEQLTQATEIAVRAANGTYSARDRAVMADQLRSIATTVAGLANGTDLRGQPLFGGGVTASADGSFAFADTPTSAIPIGDGQEVAPSVAARDVMKLPGGRDIGAVLSAMADALSAGGGVAAQDSADLAALAAQNTAAQASVGARAARVELQAGYLTTAATEREEARSAIEDTDVTEAITELQKTMTILSATQASFAKLSSLSLFSYLR